MKTKIYTWPAVLVALLIPVIMIILRYLNSPTNNAKMAADYPLSKEQKSRLHEVADLMLEVYQTLSQMRYLDPLGIQKGPHDTSSMEVYYDEYGLDPSIKYLYSILPYIDTHAAGNSDFLHGGTFTSFLNPEDVEQGRDPFYVDSEGDDFETENGPYIRPWITPLSQLGNHGSVIIYDAKRHRIWIIDQESWTSTDLVLHEQAIVSGTPPESNSINRNSFDHIPSRPAGDVLRDIIEWYRSLRELPGGGEQSGLEWDHYDDDIGLRGQYQRNGWPDNSFDGDAFEIGQARGYAASRARWFAEEPLRQVDKYELWMKMSEETLRAQQRVLREAETTTTITKEDEWVARFRIWEEETLRGPQHAKGLREAKELADRLCPNRVCQKKEDLPFWEVEFLQKEYQVKQDELARAKEWLSRLTTKGNNNNNDDDDVPSEEKEAIIALHHATRKEEIYRRALMQAKADAERLCPDKTFQSVTSIIPDDPSSRDGHRAEVDRMLSQKIEAVQGWLSTIPSDVVQAREMAVNEISKMESWISGS